MPLAGFVLEKQQRFLCITEIESIDDLALSENKSKQNWQVTQFRLFFLDGDLSNGIHLRKGPAGN